MSPGGGPRLLLRRLREIMAEQTSAQMRLDKLVNVIASKVRRKLRPFGCDFVTVYGRGYLLEEPVRQRLLNWNAGQVAA